MAIEQPEVKLRRSRSFRIAQGGRAPAKQRAAVAAILKTILAQGNKTDAEVQRDTVADALREKQDKFGAFMDASRDDVLAYMAFPREHWNQIASTNPRERVNREIKRRADVDGVRAFLRTGAVMPSLPNYGAIVRLVAALMLEKNPRMIGRAAVNVT